MKCLEAGAVPVSTEELLAGGEENVSNKDQRVNWVILKCNRSSCYKLTSQKKVLQKWRHERRVEIWHREGEKKLKISKFYKIAIYKTNLAATGIAKIPVLVTDIQQFLQLFYRHDVNVSVLS